MQGLLEGASGLDPNPSHRVELDYGFRSYKCRPRCRDRVRINHPFARCPLQGYVVDVIVSSTNRIHVFN